MNDYREKRHNMCKIRNIIVKHNPSLLDRISFQTYPLLILSTGYKREIIYSHDDSATGDNKHVLTYPYWVNKDKKYIVDKMMKEINNVKF